MDFKISFVLLSTLYGITLGQDSDDYSRLYNNLTTNYNRNIRPIENVQQPTIVDSSFILLSIKEFEEKEGKLEIVGIFTFTWKDKRMAWDPHVHAGIYSLLIPQNQVWIPEVVNAQPYEKIEPLGFERLNARVMFDGTMFWMPGDVYQTTCSADVTYYPFDIHRCEFIFTPWMYSMDEMLIQVVRGEMDLTPFTPSGVWELRGTYVRVGEIPGSQLFLLGLEFQRRPIFHVVNMLVPITILGILNVLVFLLPADSGERVGFSITVLLAMSVFLTIIADSLPSTSQPSIPRMSYLLLADLAIGTMITICTILVLRLHHKGEDETVPRWLQCLSCKRCCSKRIKEKKSTFDASDTLSNPYTNEFNSRSTNVSSITENRKIYHWKFNQFGQFQSRSGPYNEIRGNQYKREGITPHPNSSRQYPQEEGNNKQEVATSSAEDQPIVRWKDIADFCDIFLFIVFLLIIIAKIILSFLLFKDSA
ncbi:acetylcholine receptor subunit beta-like [Ylistrum balloti]|uniref:acetylcholine receptor subunit beta-like n=1 Tax=Ylistrum balloti TaxID=509963 RepID=UPI00290584A7|nr:acetylcholine receptor subunit beta-like [Ylistrum balloti]